MADGRAESGTETIVRCLLTIAGLRVRPQVDIAGVGRVDLLVEDRVVVEVDGREWHDDPGRFAVDRRRDVRATIGRYRVLRFSWFQVLFRWSEVEAAVFAALAV
jgi:very-short-patch-repair endonuclease